MCVRVFSRFYWQLRTINSVAYNMSNSMWNAGPWCHCIEIGISSDLLTLTKQNGRRTYGHSLQRSQTAHTSWGVDPLSTKICTCLSYANYAQVSISKLAQIGEYNWLSLSPLLVHNIDTNQAAAIPPLVRRDNNSRENNSSWRLTLSNFQFQNSFAHLPKRFLESSTPKNDIRFVLRLHIPPDLIPTTKKALCPPPSQPAPPKEIQTFHTAQAPPPPLPERHSLVRR